MFQPFKSVISLISSSILAAVSIFSYLFKNDLNSNLLIHSRLSFVYRFPTAISEISVSMGASVTIVTSIFENLASSIFSASAFDALGGLSSLTCSIAFSIEWYSCIIFVAVFSPIEGTPGTLSEVSPISAFTSINSFGVTPYSLITSSGR